MAGLFASLAVVLVQQKKKVLQLFLITGRHKMPHLVMRCF